MKITSVTGRGIPVRGNDIDTDQIIPARYMKILTFEGLGEYAFYDLRYDDSGTEKDHSFNDPRFTGASMLVVNRNFGCGSSREHAPQALMHFGIRAVIGESFAEIFQGNCTALGIPAVRASAETIGFLMNQIEEDPGTALHVDVAGMQVSCGNHRFPVDIDPSSASSLVSGSWDSTSVLLDNTVQIRETASMIPYLTAFRIS